MISCDLDGAHRMLWGPPGGGREPNLYKFQPIRSWSTSLLVLYIKKCLSIQWSSPSGPVQTHGIRWRSKGGRCGPLGWVITDQMNPLPVHLIIQARACVKICEGLSRSPCACAPNLSILILFQLLTRSLYLWLLGWLLGRFLVALRFWTASLWLVKKLIEKKRFVVSIYNGISSTMSVIS